MKKLNERGKTKKRGRNVSKKEDLVNHPSHYLSSNGLETIDVIEETLDDRVRFVGYLWGNIIKYISRWPRKGGVQDLKKAVWYINKLIETLEKIEKDR